MKEVIRPGLDVSYTSWAIAGSGGSTYDLTATGSGNAGTNVYLGQAFPGYVSLINPNVETYDLLNSHSQTDVSLDAKFKTAVVANRMTYIGNVQVTSEDGEEIVLGDAMLKSAVNKFDTFPISRKIEASVNDGDEIVKLEEYADRILKFKKKKMHLINISQEIEFLEDTFMYKGVSHPSAVCKTDFGIAWINSFGCYLYDGQKVINLLEDKGKQTIKESDWETFTANTPMIGYTPKKRQLFIVDDNTATGSGTAFIYDMVTQSWVKGAVTTVASNKLTNFIVDWNGDLVYSSVIGSVVKWSDASNNNDGLVIKTKDIDFGFPGVRKKIYKVLITYQSGNNTTNVQVDYDVNGGTTFPYDFENGTNFSSTELLPANGWQVAELKPDVPSEADDIKSFRLRFATDGTVPGEFEINDISIIYRIKKIK